jgi:FkbM family methyltransferase
MIIKKLGKVVPLAIKRRIYQLLISNDIDNSMFFKINNLKKLGYSPSLIIDVGAYKGEWTQRVLEIFPRSKFIMIEPQTDKIGVLSRLQGQHSSIKFFHSLVGKENKDDVLFYEMETGSSIYAEQTAVTRSKKLYNMKTLDTLLIIKEKEDVFLKLDVQGAEIDVLEGAKACLESTSFILLEASLLDYNAGAPLVGELVEYLSKKNFVLFDICEMRRKKDHTLFQVDLLFTKRDSIIRQQVNFRL